MRPPAHFMIGDMCLLLASAYSAGPARIFQLPPSSVVTQIDGAIGRDVVSTVPERSPDSELECDEENIIRTDDRRH